MEFTICVLAALIVLLLCAIFASEHLHRKERIDLYNRIMAKDLGELKSIQEPRPAPRNAIKKNIEHDLIRSGFLKQ